MLWDEERIIEAIQWAKSQDIPMVAIFVKMKEMREDYQAALDARLPDDVKETLLLLIEEQARQLSTPDNMLWDGVKDALNDLGYAKMWLEGNWPE